MRGTGSQSWLRHPRVSHAGYCVFARTLYVIALVMLLEFCLLTNMKDVRFVDNKVSTRLSYGGSSDSAAGSE